MPQISTKRQELTYSFSRDGGDIILPSRADSTSTTGYGKWLLQRSAISASNPAYLDGHAYSRQRDRPSCSRQSMDTPLRRTLPPCATASTPPPSTCHGRIKRLPPRHRSSPLRSGDSPSATFSPNIRPQFFHKVTGDLTDSLFPRRHHGRGEKWAQAAFDPTPVDSIVRPVRRALPSNSRRKMGRTARRRRRRLVSDPLRGTPPTERHPCAR